VRRLTGMKRMMIYAHFSGSKIGSLVLLSLREALNRKFFYEKSWPISRKRGPKIGGRTDPAGLSCISTMQSGIGYCEISIVSESQNFYIRLRAWILYLVTSGYSNAEKKVRMTYVRRSSPSDRGTAFDSPRAPWTKQSSL
jgi:hypothetical protein